MSRPRSPTLVRGAAIGAASFLVGYLVTWILAGAKAASLTVTGPFGGTVPDWKAVLWLFYDSHFVGTRTPEIFGPGGGLWSGGDLVDTVGLLDAEYLFAVPIVLLLLAGAAVVMLVDATGPREGFFAGITVAIGYFVVVVLGLFVATEGGVAPSPLRAVVIAGVVYPIAFGALGGAATGLLGRDTTDRHSESATR